MLQLVSTTSRTPSFLVLAFPWQACVPPTPPMLAYWVWTFSISMITIQMQVLRITFMEGIVKAAAVVEASQEVLAFHQQKQHFAETRLIRALGLLC